MPAQSPTLSPTLSAIVAGFLGSSSGMPASTLPTRSPPTSAPLVKMPPPRRAKIEMSDAPKPSATSASITGRIKPKPASQEGEVDRNPKKREARHQETRDRAGLEGDIDPAAERGGRRLGCADVGAHRYVHADEAGRGRKHSADRKADADPNPEEECDHREQDDPDDADGHVLSAQVGLRAFGDRSRDLLHALRARIAFHHVVDGPQSVGDGAQAAQDDEDECGHCTVLIIEERVPSFVDEGGTVRCRRGAGLWNTASARVRALAR